EHLVGKIASTPAQDEPFSPIYLEGVFPEDVSRQLLSHLPDPAWYSAAAERHYGRGNGGPVRSMSLLTPPNLAGLPDLPRELWEGIAAALTAPELKLVLFRKLARDLAFRYGVPKAEVGRLAGYSRPTLYRETEGFEIAPHPDTRRKVVTMQL